MSTLMERLQQELNDSRRAQDKPRTLLLGTVMADVKNRRIELRRDPSDEEVVDVLRRGIKRRRESIEMYGKAGRDELAERERAEVAMLEAFLPPAVDEKELRDAVRDAIDGGAANLGAVMGAVLPRFKGRADGKVVSAIAREELSRQG